VNFNTLYNLLVEANGDPLKYVARGPAGFSGNTGIDNPQKFTPTDKGPGDKGIYIAADARRLISMAFSVTLADTKAGSQLKDLVEEIGSVLFEFKNSKQEAQSARKQWERIPKEDSDRVFDLKEREKEYLAIATKAKERIDKLEPFFFKKLQELIKDGATNFVKVMQSKPTRKISSLSDLDDAVKVMGEDKVKVVNFLKDIYRGEKEFLPLSKYITAQKEEGQDPLPSLITMYKSVADTMSRKGLVSNPEKVFDFLAGTGSKVRSIVEPTKGRVAMKKKDPALMKVIALIKQGKFDEAKSATNSTQLPNDKKAELMMNIEKLKSGKMTEADVIRPLYQV